MPLSFHYHAAQGLETLKLDIRAAGIRPSAGWGEERWRKWDRPTCLSWMHGHFLAGANAYLKAARARDARAPVTRMEACPCDSGYALNFLHLEETVD